MTNKEIVKAWFAAIDAKDFSALKNLMDTKYQFRNPFSPVPLGGDEHIGIIQMMSSSFDGAIHIVENMVAEGAYVAMSGMWNAKHTGEFNGTPASGVLVELSFLDIFHIVNGKVVSSHVEFNPMAINAQIGAAPVNV